MHKVRKHSYENQFSRECSGLCSCTEPSEFYAEVRQLRGAPQAGDKTKQQRMLGVTQLRSRIIAGEIFGCKNIEFDTSLLVAPASET